MGNSASRSDQSESAATESSSIMVDAPRRSHKSAASTTCVLDEHVLNRHTVHNMTNLGLSIFADLCGRNRGVFVEPGDAATYSCLTLPPSFADGLADGTPMATSNDVDHQLAAGNITGSQAIHILQKMNQAVYAASTGAEWDVYGCNLNGLSKLDHCPFDTLHFPDEPKATIWRSDGAVVRAVTLAGLFTSAPWATGGRLALTVKEAQTWYTPTDFADIKALGLNTVVIPIPTSADFWIDHHHHNRNDNTSPHMQLLRTILGMVSNAKLQAILQLEAGTSSLDDMNDAVTKATSMVRDHYYPDTVMAIQLPPASPVSSHHHPSDSLSQVHALVSVARKVSKHVKILVTVNAGQLPHVNYWYNDPHVYAALSTEHTSTVADIASSTSLDDRMKLFYHESVACMQRAPLDYSTCYKNLPVFVSGGFDLAIDNCADASSSPTFVDYGQCDRWDETIHSDWWYRHRQSFAQRQLTANEYGLGWTFAAWKVWDDSHGRSLTESSWSKKTSSGSHSAMGVTKPSQLFSFQAVSAAGLFPDLVAHATARAALQKKSKHKDDAFSTTYLGPVGGLPSCLNPPLDDFTLGDLTVSPTPGPPPDCGNGWWNVTIQECSYWVPPPPCPVCEVCYFPQSGHGGSGTEGVNETVAPEVVDAPEVVEVDVNTSHVLLSTDNHTSPEFMWQTASLMAPNPGVLSMPAPVTTAFFAGALTAMMVGLVSQRVFGNRYRNGGHYTRIPH